MKSRVGTAILVIGTAVVGSLSFANEANEPAIIDVNSPSMNGAGSSGGEPGRVVIQPDLMMEPIVVSRGEFRPRDLRVMDRAGASVEELDVHETQDLFDHHFTKSSATIRL